MLTDLTIAQAQAGLRAKEFSAVELTEAHLRGIDALNPRLNAFITVTQAQALEQAKAADESIARGDIKTLTGIPLAVKDLFCTEGVRTTACSNILGNFIPTYESTVTSNLWRDGAVMLGKLNLDEFAMGSSNETSAFGPVVNPWRAEGSNRQGPKSRSRPAAASTGSPPARKPRSCWTSPSRTRPGWSCPRTPRHRSADWP